MKVGDKIIIEVADIVIVNSRVLVVFREFPNRLFYLNDISENVQSFDEEQSKSVDKIHEIKEIISFCEEVQESNESVYTKKCAKFVAYDHIKEIIEESEG